MEHSPATIETHPLEPFLPEGARMLMLGSFPPPRARWSMEFFYPNLQNDMWRIFGLVFFGDREHFLTEGPADERPALTDGESLREGRAGRSARAAKPRLVFSRELIAGFLEQKGIALSDTALRVVRHAGNASDKFLEIVETVDLARMLERIPRCRVIVTTGDKASRTLSELTRSPEVGVGEFADFTYEGRPLRHYRMPSSSRAYPLSLDKKAAAYREMFLREGFLDE